MGKRLGIDGLSCGVCAVCAASVLLSPATARAQDQAIVGVGGFAEPPPREPARVASYPPQEPRDEPLLAQPPPQPELYRSPMRLELGPAAATTGRGIAPGLGVAADFGTGSVGLRLAAAWLRGEPSAGGDAAPSPIAGGLAQYTGELALDLRKRGPVHPVLGIGFGLAHISGGGASGNLGIGTARLGLEYALSVEDADVRIGGGVTGVLPGPADTSVQDVKGWALAGVTLAVGF
jgi:hypothetical protein